MTLVFTQHFPFNQHDLFWNALTLTYAALVDDASPRGEARAEMIGDVAECGAGTSVPADMVPTASANGRRNQVRHPAARHLWHRHRRDRPSGAPR